MPKTWHVRNFWKSMFKGEAKTVEGSKAKILNLSSNVYMIAKMQNTICDFQIRPEIPETDLDYCTHISRFNFPCQLQAKTINLSCDA